MIFKHLASDRKLANTDSLEHDKSITINNEFVSNFDKRARLVVASNYDINMIEQTAFPSTVNLFLAVTRFSLGTTNRHDLEAALRKEIDWKIFNNLLLHHRLGPLIYEKFSDSETIALPDTTNTLLKQILRSNAVKNLFLTAKIIEIFREFKNSHIPVLSVKGLALENWLYEKKGIRSSGDIDLFINARHIDNAMKCMESMGYRPVYVPGRFVPGSRFGKQFVRTQKDFVFRHQKSGTMVDLHWRLALSHSAFPLDFDKAWEEKSTFTIANNPIHSLSEHVHAVYLCYHGSKHYWYSLFWLYDIALLMLKPELEWTEVLNKTKHLNAEHSVGLAIILASRVFHAPIPEYVRQRTDIMAKGERLAEEIFLPVLAEMPDWPSGAEFTLASVRQNLTWNSRISPSTNHFGYEWLRYVTAPGINDWESLKLPDGLTPLYRAWRPLRLIFKSLVMMQPNR